MSDEIVKAKNRHQLLEKLVEQCVEAKLKEKAKSKQDKYAEKQRRRMAKRPACGCGPKVPESVLLRNGKVKISVGFHSVPSVPTSNIVVRPVTIPVGRMLSEIDRLRREKEGAATAAECNK